MYNTTQHKNNIIIIMINIYTIAFITQRNMSNI